MTTKSPTESADRIYILESAGKHARYAAEDIADALELLPTDSPQFAGVDLSAALRHAAKASDLLASAAQAAAK